MTALYFGWPAFRNLHFVIWGGGGWHKASVSDCGGGGLEGDPPHYIHPWRATPAETMKVCALPTCTTRRDGVRGARAHGGVGMQVADDLHDTRRGGAIGPHAHGSAVGHVVDDQDAEGSAQQRP